MQHKSKVLLEKYNEIILNEIGYSVSDRDSSSANKDKQTDVFSNINEVLFAVDKSISENKPLIVYGEAGLGFSSVIMRYLRKRNIQFVDLLGTVFNTDSDGATYDQNSDNLMQKLNSYKRYYTVISRIGLADQGILNNFLYDNNNVIIIGSRTGVDNPRQYLYSEFLQRVLEVDYVFYSKLGKRFKGLA